MPEENVLVIPRALFDRIGTFHGLSFNVDRYLPAMLARENNSFMPRSRAENDPLCAMKVGTVPRLNEGQYPHSLRCPRCSGPLFYVTSVASSPEGPVDSTCTIAGRTGQ